MLRPLHCLASLREAGSKFPLTYKGDVSTQIPSPLAIIFELISGGIARDTGYREVTGNIILGKPYFWREFVVLSGTATSRSEAAAESKDPYFLTSR